MMKTLVRTIVTVSLLVLTLLTQTASADHSWNGYHWPRPNSRPVIVQLANHLPAEWQPYFRSAVAAWDRSPLIAFRVLRNQPPNPSCLHRAGQVQVCSNLYGFNGWLGRAQIRVNGSHITSAVVQLNDSYFSTAEYNTRIDRNHVMCHELGHTLGLDHFDHTRESLGTCMDYSRDRRSQLPNRHDYEQLRTIYSHVHRAPAASETPQVDVAAPQGTELLGALVESSPQSAVYELDLGGGQRVITHVSFAQ